ncbi:MAG: LysR family transcriptional regulator [Firmicutes bacterium]|nr:LysR family transcriptional regulator [Bacillota bacterium]
MKNNGGEEYIRIIAEMKSISAAAEVIGITQPALSAFLKKQEKELNTVLFDRSKVPLELTESGKAYLNYIEKHRLMLRQLKQEISDIDKLKTGHLAIGGATFFNIAYLPVVIERYQREYPGIDIEIVDGKIPEITAKAQQGELDLFITPIAGEDSRFQYEKFISEDIYLAVPSEWDVNDKIGQPYSDGIKYVTESDFRELCRYTFIVLKEDQHIGKIMRELFSRYDAYPEKTVIAEQTMTTLALTIKGVGISMITESSIRNCGLADLPELYMADESLCRRDMYIAHAGDRYLSRPAEEFIRILKEEYRK